MSLLESKAAMSSFYDKLEQEKRHAENMNNIRNSRENKLGKIKSEVDGTKEDCVQRILSKIYTDALPINDEYKAANKPELDNGVISFFKKKSPDGSCMGYIAEAVANGSVQAKQLYESVDKEVLEASRKFYEELEEKDIDEIEFTDNDKESIVENISGKLSYPEISQIIQDNVRATVQNEITKTKEEDQKIKDIQDQLSNDETIVTEESVNEHLKHFGYGETVYEPSLFSAIMIGKVTEFTESTEDIDDEHIEKKAFVESVKEFTKWNMLSVMNFEKFSDMDLKKISTDYAACRC